MAELTGIRQQVTAVWGGADGTHALTSRASLLRDLPEARFVEFPRCGHFPSLEAPEQYYPLLEEALAGRGPARRPGTSPGGP